MAWRKPHNGGACGHCRSCENSPSGICSRHMNLRTVCIFLLSLVAASRIDAEAQVVVDNSPWSVTDSVLTVSKTVLREASPPPVCSNMRRRCCLYDLPPGVSQWIQDSCNRRTHAPRCQPARQTVLRVEAYAFADRNDIREVRFEDGSRLHSIGEYAFM